jgi:hypothetical protein
MSAQMEVPYCLSQLGCLILTSTTMLLGQLISFHLVLTTGSRISWTLPLPCNAPLKLERLFFSVHWGEISDLPILYNLQWALCSPHYCLPHQYAAKNDGQQLPLKLEIFCFRARWEEISELPILYNLQCALCTTVRASPPVLNMSLWIIKLNV